MLYYKLCNVVPDVRADGGMVFIMMKKEKNLRKSILAALFLSIGLMLPLVTMQLPMVGKMLCPMHIPVLLSGFILGGPYGMLVGFIMPLLRSVIFGMPVMLPDAVCMAFELGTYGFVTGFLSEKTHKGMKALYIVLIAAMLSGRMVWGFAAAVIYTFVGAEFTWKIFFMVGFVNAVPGILLQLVFVPVLVKRLYMTGEVSTIYGEYRDVAVKKEEK